MTETGEPGYVRSANVVARRVAGELLLVPVAGRAVEERRRSAELFVLNESAERLWEWLASPATVSDLARNLMGEYKVTAELARQDVVSFLASMRELGAVDETTGGDVDERR